MVLAQRETKSDGKIMHLKQLLREYPGNQRNSSLEDPRVTEHCEGQAKFREHCVRVVMSSVEGLWVSIEGSSLVLAKLRRSGQNVLCCSCCTAQTQVSVGILLSLVQGIMHSKGWGILALVFLNMDFANFEKLYSNTIWLCLHTD